MVGHTIFGRSFIIDNRQSRCCVTRSVTTKPAKEILSNDNKLLNICIVQGQQKKDDGKGNQSFQCILIKEIMAFTISYKKESRMFVTLSPNDLYSFQFGKAPISQTQTSISCTRSVRRGCLATFEWTKSQLTNTYMYFYISYPTSPLPLPIFHYNILHTLR